MIEIDHLTKRFDTFAAVDDLSFNVREGEVLGFLGPNGAGKSTTMKIITGFLAPTSGTVKVDGHDITEDPMAVKSLIGYLPEGAPSYPDMTVLEFLEFIAEVRGLTGDEKVRRVQHVIDQVALESVCHQTIDTLSKGFKRRVGLGQAILHDPKVLILDEPTDGLDPNQKLHVRELIRNLAQDKIVIVSTHILEEVTAVCTRAIIIANGRIVADGVPHELESRSRYHRAVAVSFSREFDLRAALEGESGIADIEVRPDEPRSFTVVPEPDTALFDRLMTLSREQDWPLEELYVVRGQLEDFFRRITTPDRQAAAAAEARQ
ncbi:MAG: ATP-binding cassette domain-containing protein [Pseudohongiellaceae bacterium]